MFTGKALEKCKGFKNIICLSMDYIKRKVCKDVNINQVIENRSHGYYTTMYKQLQ